MTKIIRIFYRYCDSDYCVDRPFNTELDDQTNCDKALEALIDSMGKQVVVPALKLLEPIPEPNPDVEMPPIKAEHTFVNLGNLDTISIVNVMIYTVNDTGPADAVVMGPQNDGQ
jgi:hypothetical protein